VYSGRLAQPRFGGDIRVTRRTTILALLGAMIVGALGPATAAAETRIPFPDSMAAVGDSITQAASTGGGLGVDAPQNSWSTGTSTVNSHYLRLLAAGAPISGQNHNRSVSGAKMANLNAQMQTVVGLQPDYLTVLMGGNDLCTDTVAQMTTVADYRAQFSAAMGTLTAGSPATYVLVVSVPDVYQLWNLFKNNFWARFIWSAAGICQSLLANPGSTATADVQRRATVRQRNVDYNAALASVCAQFVRCRFDGNAAFNTPFTSSDVSGDYFHPSQTGQAKLAAVSWAAGYTWGSPPPPPPNEAPVAAFDFSCTAVTCSFTDASTDDGSIAGWSWNFGDGATLNSQNATHTYAAGGTYSVTLTVTDDLGATGATARDVTVTAPPPQQTTMTVGSLTSTTAPSRNTWTATVTILVVSGGVGVPNATVTATWTVGAPDSCVTGSDGRCMVTSDNLNRRKVPSVRLDVTGATHASHTYVPTQTSLIVQQP
jgi:lysophospholipase L1-like esterase